MSIKRFRSIVVDGLNQLQVDQFFSAIKKPDFDDWMDFGKEMMQTLNVAKNLDPEDIIPVLVLGKEGTGKTISMSFLDPNETYYINADKKAISWAGWKAKYKKGKLSEGGNYISDIQSYTDIRDLIEIIFNDYKKEGPLVVFFLGQIEDYKSVGSSVAQRFKVLGKVATKHNIEGSVIHTYYTKIDTGKLSTDKSRYRFLTQNTGWNTGRSPMDYWETEDIPNNLQLIVDKILEKDYPELKK